MVSIVMLKFWALTLSKVVINKQNYADGSDSISKLLARKDNGFYSKSNYYGSDAYDF
tara:strand:+ start:109 stop:279 length:171 start_codon:yes stop_codon:yes gene_type:complete